MAIRRTGTRNPSKNFNYLSFLFFLSKKRKQEVEKEGGGDERETNGTRKMNEICFLNREK